MRRAFAAIAMATVLVLGGCAADDGYSDATAQALQTTVAAVTQASSGGDWAGAQAKLDEIEPQLVAALKAGDITEERAAEIRAAIAAVREDLTKLITEQQAPVDQDDDDDDGNGNGNGNDKPPKDDDKDKGGKKD